MRTNIDLNEKLVNCAKELSGKKTKRAVVDEALRLLVQLYEQRDVRQLRGKLHWDGN